MSRLRSLIALLVVILCVVCNSARAGLIDVTVNGNESLVLWFHQPGVPPAETNTLAFNTGFQPPFSFDGSTYSLIDGPALLGSVDNTGTNLYARFTSPSSPTTTVAVDVDFTSILAGTLVGRLVVTPHGAARFVAPEISTYYATGDFGFELATHRQMIIDAAFAAPTASVPEPSCAVLALAGLVFAGAARRRDAADNGAAG